MRRWLWTLLLWTLLGCQGHVEEPVVKGRIEYQLGGNGLGVVTVGPLDARFAIRFEAAALPTTRNQMLYLGKVTVTDLSDLNLLACNGRQCTRALIRMYTKDANGAGVWNKEGGYGMPIYAARAGDAVQTVGWNTAGAAVVQALTIPATKLFISLSDFPTPVYDVRADFTEAGAGTYATTLVVEYLLQ